EAQVLQRLRGNRRMVQIVDTLIHRGHFCIVLELLGANLYEMLRAKRFCGFSHLGLKIVCGQVIDALCDLYALGIVHCDLKPENIVISDPQTLAVKLIDFGSSFFGQKDAYFYIQSRFYRAPEVILGIPYDIAIDMWSFGCLVYELFVGYPLFPGKDNYDQMGRICKVVGNPPAFMVENGSQAQFYHRRLCSPDSPDLEVIKQKIANQPCSVHENILFYKFLLNILQINPLTRPTPFQIRKDPYLNTEVGHVDMWNHNLSVESEREVSPNIFENQFTSMNQYHSNAPMNQYHSNAPMNKYHSNAPMNQYPPNAPMNQYPPNAPMNQYHPNAPMNQYHPNPPMNQSP
ncbi:putative dual specificity protein kinase YAK1 like protein, partial [Dictyocoela roeselum]